MKNTSATVTDDSSTMKIGKPNSSRMTGTTPSANDMAQTSVAGFAGVRRAPGQDLNEAQATDERDQAEAHRHHAMRDPHRHPRHVADAAEGEHLHGVISRIPQHEAGENDDHDEFGNSHQPAERRRQRVHNHIHAQVLIAPGDHGGAKEGHEHHNVDLQLVCTEDGAAEAVAADDVDEIEADRGDKGISEPSLDPAHQTIENARNHYRNAPNFPRQMLSMAPAINSNSEWVRALDLPQCGAFQSIFIDY